MLTVSKCLPAGRGLAPVLLKRAPTVRLDWDVRQKSRFDAQDSSGRRLGVFLPRGTVVRGGDVLVAEDGSMVRVEAAPQPVLEVRACAQHGSPFDLMRAAYHLGNRHVQLELRPDCLLLEPDHVLADMLRAMHLQVSERQAPFEPEAGAYAAAHGHGHGHGHGHAHAHPHAPQPHAAGKPHACGHDHGPGAPGAPAHEHGPACGHGHAHGHHEHGHHAHDHPDHGHGHHEHGHHDHGPSHAASCGHHGHHGHHPGHPHAHPPAEEQPPAAPATSRTSGSEPAR